MLKLLILSWNDIYNKCLELAERIINDNFVIDFIIAISRGGLIPARILADIFDIHEIVVIKAKYYTDINKRLEKPLISIDIDISKFDNKNMLIVDDIVDTGITFSTLINKLKPYNVKTLTLYKKSYSIFTPDYFIDTTDKWVVFPWDIAEALRSLIKEGEDISLLDIDNNIKERLLRLLSVK